MTGRIALVTGGIGELGRAVGRRLARQGCQVVAMDLHPDDGSSDVIQDWKKSFCADGLSVEIVKCDVTDFDDCLASIGLVEDKVGPVDILVNCAGITRDASVRKMDKRKWDAVLTTNLDSVFNVTKQVIDGMAERGFGRVINISSINGVKGQFGQANYAAAKAGMHGFTMSLAQEVARRGVTVNTVSPGYMETSMVRAVPPEVLEQIIENIPVGRLGKTDEIAALVAFLSSEDAGYITGANFSANGGQHMH